MCFKIRLLAFAVQVIPSCTCATYKMLCFDECNRKKKRKEKKTAIESWISLFTNYRVATGGVHRSTWDSASSTPQIRHEIVARSYRVIGPRRREVEIPSIFNVLSKERQKRLIEKAVRWLLIGVEWNRNGRNGVYNSLLTQPVDNVNNSSSLSSFGRMLDPSFVCRCLSGCPAA